MIRRHSCKGVGSSVAWSLLGLAISAQSLAGTVTTDGADIVIKTKGGLEVATTDKEFSFKLGGRLQADYGRFDGYYTNNGNTADAAYFRRATKTTCCRRRKRCRSISGRPPPRPGCRAKRATVATTTRIRPGVATTAGAAPWRGSPT